MKTLKSLFMLCAGLSFCACSSDNEPQFPEGNGAVTVKIVSPSTRMISGASETQVVNGDITLKVTHSNGESSVVLKYDNNAQTYSVSDVEGHLSQNTITSSGNDLTYTFFGIGTPSKISASMYGGVPDYSTVAIKGGTPELQVAPNQIPVYGEDTSFTQGDDITNGPTQGTTYRNYIAEIDMTIPVARLEVNVQVGTMTTFGSVELLGVYLDDVKPTGNGDVTNYYLKGDGGSGSTASADGTGDAAYAILSDSYLNEDGTYNENTSIKLTGDGAATFLPANDGSDNKQYFAYNFYAGTNPEFKLLLKVTAGTGQATIPSYQYAILKDFKDATGQNTVNFQNQNIYKVNIILNDQNIQIDEEGAAIQYALTATVTKASWTAVGVTGSWGQGTTNNQQ